jgi:hypothetical protein
METAAKEKYRYEKKNNNKKNKIIAFSPFPLGNNSML